MKKSMENYVFLALMALFLLTYLHSGSPLEKGRGKDMTKNTIIGNKAEPVGEISTQKGEVTHHDSSKNKTSKTNRLARASSPYLIQHASNPVDWYEWGDVAFDKAKEEDKLVFLSIGYSACHWCHVMAHESFEDEDVAKALNEVFISIKVDREERPDIDGIYMDVCQMMTGSGGWPLTIILTPDRKPVFAGTYIPKESRYGRPGILDLTNQLAHIWKNDRKKIIDSAASITSALKRMSDSGPSGAAPSEELLHSAYSSLAGAFDSTYGGFGVSRKFPTPHNLCFLLRYWNRHKSGSNSRGGEKALQMVEQTLWAMRSGGLWDHVGYGFHRYSTDRMWLLPHFEKMLYDQALLAVAYVEAWQATGKDLYEETARKTFEYVLRDLRDVGGGFHSAEDADSEGEEGKFYVWSVKELAGALTREEAAITASVFNVTVKGNFNDEATGRPGFQNILHRTASVKDLASNLEMTTDKLLKIIESLRVKLFNVRKDRVRPGLDDKVLVDWNGLMIAALANGGRVFNDDSYTRAAREAADFILSKMKDSSGRLHHRYRNGKSGLTASVDDYAFFTWGLIELYEATFEVAYLNEAIDLTETLIAHYWDKGSGSFFFSPDDGEKLLIRKKDSYDGATPSGNSVSAMNLLRLARITGRSDFEARAAAIPRTFASSLQKMANSQTHLLCALDFAFGPSSEIVIAEGNDAAGARAMLDLIERRFNPNKVVLLQSEDLLEVAPYTKDYASVDGKATAYLCRDFKCSLPVTKLEDLAEMLAKK